LSVQQEDHFRLSSFSHSFCIDSLVQIGIYLSFAISSQPQLHRKKYTINIER